MECLRGVIISMIEIEKSIKEDYKEEKVKNDKRVSAKEELNG